MLDTCGCRVRKSLRLVPVGRTYLPDSPRQVLKQGQRANAGREGTSVLTVVGSTDTEKQPEPVSVLDELIRDGARRMLAAALHAEVAAHNEAFADVRGDDGRRLVVRNGSHQNGPWSPARSRSGRRGSTTNGPTRNPRRGSGSRRRSRPHGCR